MTSWTWTFTKVSPAKKCQFQCKLIANIFNTLSSHQYIDQMRQRTVMEVRESLSQAISHILTAIPKPSPPPPPPAPAPQPAVEYPSFLKGPLGQIMQQFNSFATNSSDILNEVSRADVGKVDIKLQGCLGSKSDVLWWRNFYSIARGGF